MKKRKFSEEQIIGILREAERSDETVVELCRRHGVSEQSFYRWRQKFGGMNVSEVRRLRALERENARLKKLVAERDLEIDALKDVLSKNW